MNRTLLLAAVLGGLLAWLAWLLWPAGGEVVPAGPLADAHAAGLAIDEPRAVELPGDAGPREDVEPTPAAAPVAAPRAHRIAGAIVVIDPDGREHDRESGRCRVLLHFGKAFRSTEADVVDGRWVADIALGDLDPEAADAVSLTGCRLRDRTVMLEEERIALPRAGELVFRGAWLPVSTLRVLDAELGVDLTGVDVVAGVRFPYHDLTHPSGRAAEAVAAGAKSPLVLPDPSTVLAHGWRQLWVSAAGYAWRTHRHSYRDGGEDTVRLERGGDLDVWIVGEPWPEEAALRVYHPMHGGPWADVPPRAGTANAIDRLAPGTYRLRLELGDWFARPRVLGEVEVVVAAGERRTVELVVRDAATPPAKVHVHGTLAIPPAWGDHRSYLTLQPDRDTARWDGDWKTVYSRQFETGDDGLLRWSLGELYAGHYLLTVSPFQHRELVDVVAGADCELHVELPPPAEVFVRVADARSGAAVTGRRIAWFARQAEWRGGYGGSSADLDVARGGYPFQSPPGDVMIRVDQPGYAKVEQTVAVHAGRNELRIEVEPAPGVRVVFVEDGEEIALEDKDSRCELAAIEHEGVVNARKEDWVGVSVPGRYLLSLRAPVGYREIASREVVIGEAETVDVRVPLVKR